MKVIMTVIAVIMICGAAVLSYREYHEILGQEVADGKVAALEPRKGSEGGTVYVVVADFRDRQGNHHTYRSGFSASSTGYRVGDRIRIYFNRDNPSDCGVLSFGYRFGVAWILTCAGLALLLIQIGFKMGNRWLDEHFPTTVSAQQAHPPYSHPAQTRSEKR